jgi:glycosyltransferase involved in cell wall biosynthesis
MMSYFIRAFKRRSDVELLLVGPFSGDYIPWSGGMHIPQKYVITPDIPLPFMGQPIKYPVQLIPPLPWKPDLWIQFDAGFHFVGRPNAEKVVAVGTDPHVLSDSYAEVRPFVDKFFNMQKVYMQPTDIYLPYAYDPFLHKPLNLEKKFDACLVGLHYQTRDALVNTLRQSGLNVFYDIGKVYEEFVEVYNQSKVALNISSLDDLNARTFEAMGMKIPLFTNHVTDMDLFFEEGRDYIQYIPNNPEDAVKKVKFLIDNPVNANEIAESAYQIVSRGHTYDHRVSQILRECGFDA